jgi:hypothetical protein
MTDELKECFENIKEFLAEQVGEVVDDKTFNHMKESMKNILTEHGKLNESVVSIDLDYDTKDRSLKIHIQIPDFEVIYTLRNFTLEDEN